MCKTQAHPPSPSRIPAGRSVEVEVTGIQELKERGG